MKKIVFLFLIALLYSGCLTTDLSTRGDVESILLGKVLVKLHDAVDTYNMPVRGEYEDNVRVSLKHIKTGKIYNQFTDSKGYFTITNPMQGDYVIEFLTVEDKYFGNSPIHVYPVLFPFTVESDADVFALGELVVYIDKKNKTEVTQHRKLEDFKSLFSSIFPNSDWLETEWSFVPVVEY